MDSDSDFGFGGSGDEDTSFTPSHEEEEQQHDKTLFLLQLLLPLKKEMAQIQFTREALHSAECTTMHPQWFVTSFPECS